MEVLNPEFVNGRTGLLIFEVEFKRLSDGVRRLVKAIAEAGDHYTDRLGYPSPIFFIKQNRYVSLHDY